MGWAVVLAGVLLASTASSVLARGSSSIAQGFQTTESNLAVGALVGLRQDSTNSIELSAAEHVNRLLGVVADQSLIELSDDTNTVQVVTSGITYTLVSTLNGEVKIGDRVTSSPIAGVGMKATKSGIVVGVAQAGFGSNIETTSRTITNKSGKRQTVKIGLVPIQVDVAFYAGNEPTSFVPTFLQNLANSVAGGRNVSSVRVVTAGLLLLLLFLSIVAVLYSAVRSSIISIGRNPLSEGAIHKGLLQVGLTIVGLLAFTVILIYLILTL